MEIKAKLNFLRIAPRKVRAIADQVRGLSLEETESQLLISKKRAAEPVLKLLKSAIANAQNNFSLKKEDLLIKKIDVNEGPTLHRWFPRAFGRAAPIQKRSSHLLIVLEVKSGVHLKKTEKAASIDEDKNNLIKNKENKEKREESKSKKTSENKFDKKQTKGKSKNKGFAKKIFSRKAI